MFALSGFHRHRPANTTRRCAEVHPNCAGQRFLWGASAALAIFVIVCTAFIASPARAAQNDAFIRDTQGRVRYIVDLYEDDTGKPAPFRDAKEKIDWHKANSARLIDDTIKLRGIDIIASTSLVGTSFTAYLDDKQVEHLAKDKHVERLTPDAWLTPSTNLWSDTANGTEIVSWGRQAMGIVSVGSIGAATVYVIDTGVEQHRDLPSLVTQVAAFPGMNPNGCYPHATHVAGIIGAGYNGMDVVGVNPGVRLVSIAIGDIAGNNCSDGYPVSGMIQALEFVKQEVLSIGNIGVANISLNVDPPNLNYFLASSTVGAKMLSVATPTTQDGSGYRGVLIVQSAGNHDGNACQSAFNNGGSASSNDGILVVGGLDQNGQRVSRFVGLAGQADLNGFVNQPQPQGEFGSNSGSCVEMYAPSQQIISTWTNHGRNSLSGTSMAAPHVAGLASIIVDSNPYLASSHDLEAAVRASLSTIQGSNLAMPMQSQSTLTAKPTVEFRVGGLRSLAAPIDIGPARTYIDLVTLQYRAVGAYYCLLDILQSGVLTVSYNLPPSGAIPAAYMPPGDTRWNLTCFTPQYLSNGATAHAQLKRRIALGWKASTTSTGYALLDISHGDVINWSVVQNAPFDQSHWSTGADACQVRSYGFLGNYIYDQENPKGGSVGPYNQAPYPNEASPLWDSGPSFFTSYTYYTFHYGDPYTYPNPLNTMPYNGYKWHLKCTNWEGESAVSIMYGTPLY